MRRPSSCASLQPGLVAGAMRSSMKAGTVDVSSSGSDGRRWRLSWAAMLGFGPAATGPEGLACGSLGGDRR